MPEEPSRPNSTAPAHSSGELLGRARGGDSRALSALLTRHGRRLRLWARGRLPQWARSVYDTADIVQDALLHTFRRMDKFEDRGRGALGAYLRQAVTNRICDEVRKVSRRPIAESEEAALNLAGGGASPFDSALSAEQERSYKQGLAALSEDERVLIVGRIELGYNYEQLALIAKRSTPEAARVAVRRALLKLAEVMSLIENI
ncbi:MAG TPA: RNA polymerase sigma factor [Vicinamibacterales bacterium]|nr:RNA polymerase sigma factor [Vicinamibacterales bacterium]